MTDEELRSLVRAAVARHLTGHAAGAGAFGGYPGAEAAGPRLEAPGPRIEGAGPRIEVSGLLRGQAVSAHPGFHRYALSRSDDDDTCLIEPRVRCTHCGFCQSHGF